MKTNKNTNSMYALLLAAAVLVGGSIWFACSADDEFESNYEMETLAKGEMSLSNENGTEIFAGFYIDTIGLAQITEVDFLEDYKVDLLIGWDTGWTGNLYQDHATTYVNVTALYKGTNYGEVPDEIEREINYSHYIMENYVRSVNCEWKNDNKLHVIVKVYGYIYKVINGTKIFQNTGYWTDEITYEYSESEAHRIEY